MFALFKDGRQITPGYDRPDQIPVQTEHCIGHWGRPARRLLWPRFALEAYMMGPEDGYEIRMCDMTPTNFRWAVCCQTCHHFHESPVATGEGYCEAVNPPFGVLVGNVCDLHKPSADTQPA